MKIDSLDHLVLTVADIDRTAAFYRNALGMEIISFVVADGSMRTALKFGVQKINLHRKGAEFEPKAHAPTSGSADLCFLTATPIKACIKHLTDHNIHVIDGPVQRTGAIGPINSIYIRDPDQNLIEIATPA